MNKTTIELSRVTDHWHNWGIMFDKYGAQDAPVVLDAIVEWSIKNQPAKVYHHTCYRREENIQTEPVEVVTSGDPKCKVYLCDLVYYLDIYWQ
jgi:hypothetical protein